MRNLHTPGIPARAVPAVLFVPVFMAIIALGLAAQTSTVAPKPSAQSQVVWAPFVTQLRLAVKDPFIRLTWKDVGNFDGTYLIYRHTEEINKENLAKASLAGSVPQGEEYFNDTPPSSGEWYYAILAKAISGEVWSIFVPFLNITLNPVKVNRTEGTAPVFTAISGLAARVKDKKIEVSFQSSLNNRQVMVYRSAQMPSQKSRGDLVPVYKGAGRNISFLDAAIPGVAWYYAVVDMEADQQGVAAWTAGENVTPQGTEIPMEWVSSYIKPSVSARTMPLPMLTLPELGNSNPLESVAVPMEKQAMDKETLVSVNKLLEEWHGQAPLVLVPQLLPSDKLMVEKLSASPFTGENKILMEILQKTWKQKDWGEAIKLYGNTLMLNLSPETESKVRYYLGQAYYMTGKYREAFLEFLVAEEQLQEYARTWSTSCLLHLVDD